jgi:hypothetical protein
MRLVADQVNAREPDSLLVFLRWWVASFTHRFSAHLYAMGVVDQTVEDAIGDGRIADLLLSKLADVPTPAGPTPHQIGAELVQITSFREVTMPVTQDGGAKVYR